MISPKYITGNSLDWLLEQSQPDVRYLALRDIVGQVEERDYAALAESDAAVRLIKRATRTAQGDARRYDLYYTGAMWLFCEAFARGLDCRTHAVTETAAFLCEKAQLKSGGFTLTWQPPVESALHTGEMVRVMAAVGVEHESVTRGIKWILEHQRHDGGWLHWPVGGIRDIIRFMFFNRPGQGLSRENDLVVTSCPYASIACAFALVEYNEKFPSDMVSAAIALAAEFFLNAGLRDFRELSVFNSRLTIGQDFTRLGYPVFGQYDVLHGLLFCARAGFVDDPRASAAFNYVMSKQGPDGAWHLETAATGMLHGGRGKRYMEANDKWVTLNALRLLKYTSTGNSL